MLMRIEILELPKKILNAVSSDDICNTQLLGGGREIQKSIKIKIKALVIPLPRNEVTAVNIMVQYTCRLFSMPLFPTMVLTMWSPIKSISIWKLVRKANSQAPTQTY